MEKAVAAYASQLQSDKPLDRWQAIASLTQLRDSGNPTAVMQFSRTLQELAVFDRGSILAMMLKQLPTNLEECILGLDEMETPHLLGHSAFAFVIKMGSSNVLVQAFMKQEGAAHVFLSVFSQALLLRRSESLNQQDLGAFALDGRESMLTWGLEGLFTFVNVSRKFRDAVRTASVFPEMLSILNRVKVAQTDEVNRLNQKMITNFIVALTLCPDSNDWAAGDPDFLRLLAGCLTSLVQEQGQQVASDNVELQVTIFVLMRLFEAKDAYTKLRQCGAVSILEPCSRIINLAFPEAQDMWGWMKGMITGKISEVPWWVRSRHKSMWKQAKSMSFGAPTVCSWEHCTAEPESPMRLLSVCGGCGLSRYCR